MYANSASIGILTNLNNWIILRKNDQIALTILSGVYQNYGETVSGALNIMLEVTLESPAGDVIRTAQRQAVAGK
jgi:hypothetical protein